MSDHCCMEEIILTNPCQALADGDLTYKNFVTYGFTPWSYALLIAQCGTTSAVNDLAPILNQLVALATSSLTELVAINSNTVNQEAQLNSIITLLTDGNATADNILTEVQATLVQVTSIEGNTDGIEGLLASMIILLTTISTDTSDIEALVVLTNAALATLNACCTASNALLTTIDASLTAIGLLLVDMELLLTEIRDDARNDALFGTHVITNGDESTAPAGLFSSWSIVRTNALGSLVIDGLTLTNLDDTTGDEAFPQFKVPAPVIVIAGGATYDWKGKS